MTEDRKTIDRIYELGHAKGAAWAERAGEGQVDASDSLPDLTQPVQWLAPWTGLDHVAFILNGTDVENETSGFLRDTSSGFWEALDVDNADAELLEHQDAFLMGFQDGIEAFFAGTADD